MKIRLDFVTNSSSSSFILGFTDESTIKNELVAGFDEKNIQFFPRVFNNVFEAERMSKEEIIEEIKEYYGFACEYKIYYENRYKFDSYTDFLKWCETDEGKKKIKGMTKGKIEEVTKRLDKCGVLVEVTYSDHDNYELECRIMPRHPSTICTINNH